MPLAEPSPYIERIDRNEPRISDVRASLDFGILQKVRGPQAQMRILVQVADVDHHDLLIAGANRKAPSVWRHPEWRSHIQLDNHGRGPHRKTGDAIVYLNR